MATQKFYQDMSADEQLQWVTEFGELMTQHEAMIIAVGKRQQAMTLEGAKAVQRVFALLSAWPFAQDFCEKAQKYGDYSARTYRLPVYIEKVKEQLSAGLTMTDSTGRVVAYVSPSVPLRRRGRPTKEETAARLRGEAITVQEGDDAEAKKRCAIAKMLGLEVIVSGEAPREKNNAELKAEREKRKAEEERRNPSLFRPSPDPSLLGRGVDTPEQQNTSRPSIQGGDGGGSLTPCAQLMNDSYEARMAQDKLHLDQLAWLMSKPLQEREKLVQSQRTTAEAASERAKMLAEMGGKQEEIAEYAEQAKVATEAYLATYADVDEELAVLHKRTYLDMPFLEKFKQRFKGVDIEKIQYITRPYYEKVKMQEKKDVEEIRAKAKSKGENEEQAVTEWLAEHQSIDDRVKNIIEQENPEYAAKMKAEQEKKEELQQLHRYIMRTDKPASDERVKTMTERIERVRQLAGDEVADSYLPVLEKTKEENRKRNEAKSRPTPDPSLLGRGVDSDAAKKKPKKTAKPSTKQEGKKATKAQDKKKPAAETMIATPHSQRENP